ncbi:MAG: FAD-binding protein, partial [Candidatus Omnitrophica bacterium]|nr:FAD-binding protein [Candidatus Omnitrophota bacterium]
MNIHGDFFMKDYDPRGEMAPRNIVSWAIYQELQKTGSDFVYLVVPSAEEFKIKFPNLYQACIERGIDLPFIPVAPAAHFTVGGVLVDRGRTSIPGLWFSGEAAYWRFHGAERMASNSLPGGLQMGFIAAEDMFNSVLSDMRSISLDGIVIPDSSFIVSPGFEDNRTGMLDLRLGKTMQQYAGIARNEQGLREALSIIHEIRQEFISVPLSSRKAFELRNKLLVSEAVAWSALNRRESRGPHFRIDYRERDDKHYLAVSVLRRRGDGWDLEYRPMRYRAESMRWIFNIPYSIESDMSRYYFGIDRQIADDAVLFEEALKNKMVAIDLDPEYIKQHFGRPYEDVIAKSFRHYGYRKVEGGTELRPGEYFIYPLPSEQFLPERKPKLYINLMLNEGDGQKRMFKLMIKRLKKKLRESAMDTSRVTKDAVFPNRYWFSGYDRIVECDMNDSDINLFVHPSQNADLPNEDGLVYPPVSIRIIPETFEHDRSTIFARFGTQSAVFRKVRIQDARYVIDSRKKITLNLIVDKGFFELHKEAVSSLAFYAECAEDRESLLLPAIGDDVDIRFISDDSMYAHWVFLSRRLGVEDDEVINTVYREIEMRYSEKHRVYHTLNHIRFMRDEFRQFLRDNPGAFSDIDVLAMELAILGHDLVYSLGRTDNEERSAALFARILRDTMGLSEDLIGQVRNLILATKPDGNYGYHELSVCLMQDLDLAVFGFDTESFFLKYEIGIRGEHKQVELSEYKAARKQILRLFLARKYIYNTPYFREKYEEKAQKNLTRKVAVYPGYFDNESQTLIYRNVIQQSLRFLEHVIVLVVPRDGETKEAFNLKVGKIKARTGNICGVTVLGLFERGKIKDFLGATNIHNLLRKINSVSPGSFKLDAEKAIACQNYKVYGLDTMFVMPEAAYLDIDEKMLAPYVKEFVKIPREAGVIIPAGYPIDSVSIIPFIEEYRKNRGRQFEKKVTGISA